MILRHDSHTKPLYITPTGHIVFDTTIPNSGNVTDFLVAIAEPVARPELIHEYVITNYSLYAAVSVGIDADEILTILDSLSKTDLPKEVIHRVKDVTARCGKLKLVLISGNYFIDSTYKELLCDFVTDTSIASCIIPELITVVDSEKTIHIPGTEAGISTQQRLRDERRKLLNDEVMEDEDDESLQVLHYRYQVYSQYVTLLRQRANQLDLPLIEEYDFTNDSLLPRINLRLKETTTIRYYQEKSLSKMFSNGRARSGIIVLPCGGGKTLVGINASCIVQRPVIVLCTNNVALDQWRNQFLQWADVNESDIGLLTSDVRDPVRPIMLSTYSMISYTGKRAHDAQKVFDELTSKEWGLLVFDEVHVAPAEKFRQVIGTIKAKCMLGLSATLVREDQKIEDLNFLIGPKLYEADWLNLRREGFLANVKCLEVWCPMTSSFFREYMSTTEAKRNLLCTMNPNKINCCEYLMKFHEERGDRVLIFSDNLFTLRWYALKLNRPFIDGSTSTAERILWLNRFQSRDGDSMVKSLFISKVGDNSIDLPDANVLIQISSQGGSRRQEAQRLGRILRPKETAKNEFNAYFYSLVSRDSKEAYFSTKRQQFLINQGFAYETKIWPINFTTVDESKLLMASQLDQAALLAEILRAQDSAGNTEEDEPNQDTGKIGTIEGLLKEQRKRRADGKIKVEGRSKAFVARDKLLRQKRLEL
ncbi:hypothetical protein RCL1_003181 [Eukaryota sp. TZLM3-RCL]